MTKHASARFCLIVAPALLVLGTHSTPSYAGDQSPAAATAQNSVDTDKYSAAAKAAEVNTLGQQSTAPNIVDKTGQVQSQDGPGKGIPDVGNSLGGAASLNTPGTVNPEQSGPNGIPGIGNSFGGAASLNTPGTNNNQHSPDDVDAVVSKYSEQAQEIVNNASQGPKLNIPNSTTPGEKEADGGVLGFLSSVWSSITGPGGDKGDKSGASSGGAALNSSAGSAQVGEQKQQKKGDEKIIETTEFYSEEHPDQYVVRTDVISKTKDGKTEKMTVITSPGLIDNHGGGKRNTPSEDSSSSSAIGGLSAHSDLAKKNHGGGTDNNSETSSGKTGTLSPNSPYARRTHGDGGDDAGDNNRLSKGSTLANGTPLTRKNYGDGGSSDTRGGGGTPGVSGVQTVHPGGGHNELTNKTQVIGAGLLEGDTAAAAQGPSATGSVASGASGAGARGIVVRSR